MKTKVSISKVKKALEKSGGMPTYAAKSLGITYTRLYQIVKENPELELIKNSARAKLHEEMEGLSTFAIKSGYIQKAVIGDDGKPTGETTLEEVDVKKRLDMVKFLMSIYKGSAGIVDKSEIDHTTKGKEITQGIAVIELPPHLQTKEEV